MATSDSEPSEANDARKDAQRRDSPADLKDGAAKPSLLKRLWVKIDLDLPTFLIMVKASIPPIVALAMFQSNAVAAEYSTLGYLVAIMSILGFCIMPRGQFIQTMFLNLLGTCVGAAANLLGLYCAVKAREHTTPTGTPPTGYNSSASAVCAIFLIVQLYLVNYLRSARPQFNIPAIIYSIYVSVSMTYGVLFPTMAYAESFMRRLLIAFLTGFGLCTAVAFLVIPTSSRLVVFKEFTGYLNGMKGLLQAQSAYMRSLEDVDPVALREQHESESKKHKHHGDTGHGPLTTPAGLALLGTLDKIVALHTKLNGDITPAKREFAFGKLESHDLTELWKLMKMVFVPVMGLAASFDIVQRRATTQDWSHTGATEEERETRHRQIERVHYLMKQMHEPFGAMVTEISAGIDHFLLTLDLTKPPKKAKTDEEAGAGAGPAPGSTGFLEAYRQKIKNHHKSKEATLANWCRKNGIELPPNFFDESFADAEHVLIGKHDHIRHDERRSLFFTLYLDFLLWRTSVAVLDLIVYAEKRKQDGILKRSKLIFPGSQTLYKWVRATFGNEDVSDESQLVGDLGASRSASLYLGDEFSRRKDPEHLPPRNAVERIGDAIRLIPNFFRGDNSAFGVRVTVATMSIAIICYLQASQNWFLRNRILWSMIMVAISMTRTAGQSTLTFALRILGTVIAMAGSYVIWYIVDGHTAGVLVFLWLWITLAYYFVLKTPKLIIVVLLSMVTAVLIVGYELQVRKIGVQASESNGQPAYETYLLAPIRLGTVAGGLFVAYIWTIFPYPVSESTEIRRDLGAALYLTANYYSIIHELVQARVKGTDKDGHLKGTHAYHLDKARNIVFTKLMALIQNLEMNANFSKFQLHLGGRFPREEYESLIETTKRLVRYLTLIGYASKTLSATEHEHGQPSRWAGDFRTLMAGITTTSHQITSLLALLSSSISNGQPLPPYVQIPRPFDEVKQLESIDPDILSVRHIAEPEYSAFAVVQVSAQMISEDIEKLTKHVKTLVGVIDFSFHAVRTRSEDSQDSLSSAEKDGKLE